MITSNAANVHAQKCFLETDCVHAGMPVALDPSRPTKAMLPFREKHTINLVIQEEETAHP